MTAKLVVKGSRTKGKAGRRKKDSSDTNNISMGVNNSSATSAGRKQEPDWGLLEPLRALLGPVATLVSPGVVIGLLSFLVFFMWWRQSRTMAYNARGGGLGVPGLATSQRIAAYEEMWRGEESELWKWLEDRVGLDGAVPAFLNQGPDREKGKRKEWLARQRAIEMEKKVVSGEMGERQMLEAIRVTKERLQTLEEAVKRRKSNFAEPKAGEAPPPPYQSKEL